MQTVEWKKVVSRVQPEKSLTFGRKRSVGRNSQGRITTRHKGGGEKRLWREIDFRYEKRGMTGRVKSLEYDPNRTSLIALIVYQDGQKRYILAPAGLKVGDSVRTAQDAPVEIGNRLPLEKIPVGSAVHNISFEPYGRAKLARSAGASAVILSHEAEMTHLELPSKEVRMVRRGAWASIGSLSNPEHIFVTIGKAGKSRHKGIRPSVRGTAMNPVDHPHGGGEGRALIGRRRGPATPWGKLARGVKTRKVGKKSDAYILSRRR
jgi:large subunit ribosomal protein L2